MDNLVNDLAELKIDENDASKKTNEICGYGIKEKIRICMKKTCGNKVMCFEYNGQIWKEK